MLKKVYDVKPGDKILCGDGQTRQIIEDEDFFVEHMGGNYIQLRYTRGDLSSVMDPNEDTVDVI